MVEKLDPGYRHEHVVIRFPHDFNGTAGEKLQWAVDSVLWAIDSGKTPRFKIGITGNPPQRWDFYETDEPQRWERLVLIYIHILSANKYRKNCIKRTSMT
jgi:hypothetical protein